MTNKQVLTAFLNGEKGTSLNMTSTGEKLYSYNTVVAQRTHTHGMIFNATKYSSTTSKQTSYFWKNLECFNLVKYVPINSHDLIDYIH